MLGNQPNIWILIALCQFVLLLLGIIYVLVLSVRLKRIRRLFQDLMTGTTKENIENVIREWIDRLANMEAVVSSMDGKIKDISSVLDFKKGNVGIVRFNAFANEGSDLSFSIAVLDNSWSGFVLTSIYGREESRVYAKPVENGNSTYSLTTEEIEAIERAKQVP